MDHGLPQQCLGGDMNFDTIANQNTSHLVVKTVITKQCHKYKGIVDDCKSECLDTKTTLAPKPEISKHFNFVKFQTYSIYLIIILENIFNIT